MVGDFQRGGWTGDEGVNLPWGTVVTPCGLASEVPVDRAVAGVGLARQRMGGRDRVTATARLDRLGGAVGGRTGGGSGAGGAGASAPDRSLCPANGATEVTFEPFNVAAGKHSGCRFGSPSRRPGP